MTATPTGTPSHVPAATAAGRPDTRLVVIRGNSASGKTSVARGLRDHYGRGVAIVGQDVIRRNVLREHDSTGGANIALLGRIARHALDAGFHVVLEGILYADRYSHMITSLVRDHRGVSACYYLDVPLEVTLARHASKADSAYLEQVTDTHLTSWYRTLDLLPGGLETVIPADSSLRDTVARIVRETDPTAAAAPPPQADPSQGDTMNLVLMSDPRVAAIPVRECGEPLVDVRDHDVRVDPRKQDPQGAFAHVREGVLARLVHARSLLPAGTDLLFIEGYRPPALQRRCFTAYRDELAAAQPDWTPEQLHEAASRYVSPPEIAPHSAGAAVDVTLVDQDGHELDLGSRVNASPEESDGACFTHAPDLGDQARHHRTLLLDAMDSAGFTNYGTEFWHFSAADRYDALMRQAPYARYGPIELPWPAAGTRPLHRAPFRPEARKTGHRSADTPTTTDAQPRTEACMPDHTQQAIPAVPSPSAGDVPPEHHMHLIARSYRQVEAGRKTIEVRVATSSRRAISIGDTVVFHDRETGRELDVAVQRITSYPSFEDLLRSEDTTRIDPDARPGELLAYLRGIYPPDKEALGVLAFAYDHRAARPGRPMPMTAEAYARTVPHHTVYGCLYIRDEHDRPVQLRSVYGPRPWQFPGGNLDAPGEDPLETARREAVEETCLGLGPGSPALLLTHFLHAGPSLPLNKVGFIFDGGQLTADQLDQIRLDPAEHDMWAVHDLATWKELMPPLAFARLDAVERARRGEGPAYLIAHS
ncbi:M15 family metallopeptidase [Streptomyces sp. YPW6]|uniref:M15 family metallopeptidase n=1 Tax=Streptomyces sp. YPW6 TaxID=2840373 RepID=UPI003EC0A111